VIGFCERSVPGAWPGGPRSLFVEVAPSLVVVEAVVATFLETHKFQHEGRRVGPGVWHGSRYRWLRFL
jgi:hypothetical protein